MTQRSRVALKVLLGITGAIMIIAGATTAVFGVAPSVPREGTVTAQVESEMRFYAVWYAVAGAALLRTLRNLDDDHMIVPGVAIGFFAAGSARLIAAAVVGKPHVSQILLMIVELVFPFVVIPWHRALVRAHGAGGIH